MLLKNLETIAYVNGLFPSHYLSTPGLSWDAMLKITKLKPELMSDLDMCIFFEKGTKCCHLLYFLYF